jgi:hypothetical protein
MKTLTHLTMKSLLPLVLFYGVLSPLHAATTVDQWNFTVGSVVPDNDGIGLSDTRQISTTITYITGATVYLSMGGGWAGDLYAYVTHASGFTVLLNRPGRSLENIAGSGANELQISFTDTALSDIHTGLPASGSAVGFFQPDAREIDPDNSLDSSPRAAFLSSFNGLDPNGEWTLFVADLSGGDQMILYDWAVTLKGVPEPSTTLLAILGGAALLRRRRTDNLRAPGITI